MATTANTPQEKPRKRARKQTGPIVELDNSRFDQIHTAMIGAQLIEMSFPNLKEPLNAVLEKEASASALFSCLVMNAKRKIEHEKEQREKEKNPEPPIKMSKKEFMDKCLQCWMYAPDRNFVKKWANTMFFFVVKEIDKQNAASDGRMEASNHA